MPRSVNFNCKRCNDYLEWKNDFCDRCKNVLRYEQLPLSEKIGALLRLKE